MPNADPYLAIKINPQFIAFVSLIALLEDYEKQMSTFPKVGSSDELKQATQEIALPTITDLLAIRKLIELGFGSTAETLLRTQIERVATISFLRNHPHKIKKWVKKGGDVEYLKVRINSMLALKNPLDGKVVLGAHEFTSQMKDYVDALQALVHCNRSGAYVSSFESDEGTVLVAGSNPYNSIQISRVSNYSGQVLCYLIQELNLAFPKLKEYYLGEAA